MRPKKLPTTAAKVDDTASNDPSPPAEDRVMKLASLRRAVEDGTYRISSQNIADKIIDHLRDVPPKT